MSLQGKAWAGDTLRGKINSLREVRIDPYDIAVQNGFDGTKEDWLKKLVGDSELLESVNGLHAWKKISLESIGETELSNAILSYYNPGSTSDLSNNVWDTVSYSNTIDIVDGELVLVNPTTFVMSNDSDYNVVKGKYIKTGYDNNFYRIPRDATISYQKPTYGNSNYIRSSVAMHLTVVDGSLLGYVVSDESDSYPVDGEQGGYRYEYIGLVDGNKVDTSDATATASDMAQWVTAYVDGEKVTGTLPDGGMVRLFGGNAYNYLDLDGNSGVLLEASADTDRIIRAGDKVGVVAPYNQFGNSMPGDVRKGTTFTSAAGWLATGEHECDEGVELPDLGDTAAQPTDMVAGKVLYDDKGNPVTGTLLEADEIDEALFANRDFTFGGTPGGTTFSVKGAYAGNTDGVVVRTGAGLGVRNAPTGFFGDAMPGDVKKGIKFTSAAGLLVEGTHECEAGMDVSIDGETLVFSDNSSASTDGETLIL